jgi:hypothetical protein
VARRGGRARASRGRPSGVFENPFRHDFRPLDVWQMPCAFNDFKTRAGDQRGRFPNQSDGRRAVLVADQAKGRRFDPSGIWSEVGALQGPAGGKIALARRPREHGAYAGKRGGSPGSEIGGEPPFEDGIGQGFDAAALDLSDSLVPNLIRSDFRRRVAKDERRDAIGGVDDKAPAR